MWIARRIRVRMMNAMSHDPVNGSTFQSKQTAKGQEIFDYFRCLVTTMRQQAVKAHADAEGFLISTRGSG